MLPHPSRRALSTAALLLPAALLLAACGKSAKEIRADSLAAVAAVQATRDSINAIKVVMVDTAIAPALKVELSKMTKTASGMYIGDRRIGTGVKADSNKWVLVDYTAYLSSGDAVDDTRAEGGEPRRVLLGHKQVLPAWEEGLRGMREGGRRIIVAPPSMAYGLPGKPGTVPEMATMVFDIELRKVY